MMPQVPCPACVCTFAGEDGVSHSTENTESQDVAVVSSATQRGTAPRHRSTTTTNYILLLFSSSSRRENKPKVRLVGGGHRA